MPSFLFPPIIGSLALCCPTPKGWKTLTANKLPFWHLLIHLSFSKTLMNKMKVTLSLPWPFGLIIMITWTSLYHWIFKEEKKVKPEILHDFKTGFSPNVLRNLNFCGIYSRDLGFFKKRFENLDRTVIPIRYVTAVLPIWEKGKVRQGTVNLVRAGIHNQCSWLAPRPHGIQTM